MINNETKEKLTKNLPKCLIKLAKLFKKAGAELFVVGGFVRDTLGDLEKSIGGDFDLASSLGIEQIEALLKNTEFKCKLVNKKLGTLHISNDAGVIFEHTTFRKENYTTGHTPEKVDFVCDLKTDAKRRDFTINCIYFSILNGNVLDIYNGIGDLKNKVIRCIESPQYVFQNDGLRILRLVRFACQLKNFKIDKQSFEQAKLSIEKLGEISHERKAKELNLSLQSFDKEQNDFQCFLDFVENLIKLNAFPYIFDKTNLDLSKINLENWKVLRPHLFDNEFATNHLQKFTIILCLLLQIDASNVDEVVHLLLSSKGLQIEKKKVAEIASVVEAYFYMLQLELDVEKCIPFVQNYNGCFDEIMHLLGFCNKDVSFEKQAQIEYELEGAKLYMRLNDIPLSRADLPINGWDIKRTFPNIEKSRIKAMLDWAFVYATKHATMDKMQILFAMERKEKDEDDDFKSMFGID